MVGCTKNQVLGKSPVRALGLPALSGKALGLSTLSSHLFIYCFFNMFFFGMGGADCGLEAFKNRSRAEVAM